MLTKARIFSTTPRKVTAGDSCWQGKTSPDYWAFVGPFGGCTAATILRALIDHPQRAGDPLALTVNFCAPVAEGGFRSRRPPGQGQPLEPALVRGDDAGRRRRRDAGDRGIRRAPSVLVAPAGGISRTPRRSNRRAVSEHADDVDAPVRFPLRRGRAELLRLAGGGAARRVFQAVDRRPHAAKDRHAVADVDVGCVLRPGVSGAARTDPVRHGIASRPISTRRRRNSRPRTSPMCWRWPTPGFSTGATATSTANCGRRRDDCSRRRRRSPISRRERCRVRASSSR